MKRSGFYRVNYDIDNWNKLINQLLTDFEKIEETSRAQLLDDAFNLGRAEYIDQTVFLTMGSYLKNEKSALVFQTAFYGLEFISDMLVSDAEAFDQYKEYYLPLIEKQYQRLGWRLDLNVTTDIDLQLTVLRIMCKYGNPACIQKAREYYDNWQIQEIPIPPNFKSIVYQTVVQNDGKTVWNNLYNIALETSNSAEKLRILRALTYTPDYQTLKL